MKLTQATFLFLYSTIYTTLANIFFNIICIFKFFFCDCAFPIVNNMLKHLISKLSLHEDVVLSLFARLGTFSPEGHRSNIPKHCFFTLTMVVHINPLILTNKKKNYK